MSVEIKKRNPIEQFAQSAENVINKNTNSAIRAIQEQAKSDLQNSQFPTLKTEEWKYTNLNKFLANEFVHTSALDKVELKKTEIDALVFDSFNSHV